jgi:hypothetical protein
VATQLRHQLAEVVNWYELSSQGITLITCDCDRNSWSKVVVTYGFTRDCIWQHVGWSRTIFSYTIIMTGIHLATINNNKRVIMPFTRELKLKFHLNSSENMFCNLLQLKEMSWFMSPYDFLHSCPFILVIFNFRAFKCGPKEHVWPIQTCLIFT